MRGRLLARPSRRSGCGRLGSDHRSRPCGDHSRLGERTLNALDSAWRALRTHAAEAGTWSLRRLFAEDPRRFERFSLVFEDLLLDWSRQLVRPETMRLLSDLARAADLEGWRARMFAGEPVNTTENRAALHVALRHRGPEPILCRGKDVMPEVRGVLARMKAFSDAVRDGRLRGATGLPFRDVVNIGIGGSDLGPQMVCRALAHLARPDLRVHFVSNLDGAHLAPLLARLDPAATLFVVASKTFTTQETMQNAASARAWLAARLGEEAVAQHFVAVSTNEGAVRAFGIDPERSFGFWEWVGGRFSLWSAIGLPIALCVGFDRFEELLEGGYSMDRHFASAPLARNLPAIHGLLAIWNRDLLGFPTRAVLPYDQRLERLPAFLQQLEMESNGKRVRRDGRPVEHPTCPVVWGEVGTNGQHAFFQLLHQGTDVVPCEFIVCAEADHGLPGHHEKLLANVLAQMRALAFGRDEAEARAGLEAAGLSGETLALLSRHRAFPGNRPSTAIVLDRLTPRALGRLIALYEHSVFVQGVIWEIDSFDQWGVELGKELATRLLPAVESGTEPEELDGSTRGLLRHLRSRRRALADG
ncbi:MAG: glucose-6-phosphate isomerase [Geminicoccaceae bacterium]|nr:glucose-6-phosphate isomerase [Geminicoccaceae bacterium]MCX7630340.1 glucose-6-phosphate isomerase [Geminicoccaceae bacterium]